jgi:hypothetical protein
MIFLDKGRHLAQITKCQYHTYGRKQHGQLERDGYPCRQGKKRLTAKVQRPVIRQRPGNKAQCRAGSGDAINESCRMKAGLPKPHCRVQAMNRHGCIYIMDLVSCFAHLFYRRKQNCFIIKTTDYEFFNRHIQSLSCELHPRTDDRSNLFIIIILPVPSDAQSPQRASLF